MPTLHVRSVPQDLYDQLRDMANDQRRSLSAQVVAMLERALEAEARQQRQAELLDHIYQHRYTPPQDAPESTAVLREDRAR